MTAPAPSPVAAYLACFADDGIPARQARLREVFDWVHRTGGDAERMFEVLTTLASDRDAHVAARRLLPSWTGTPADLAAAAMTAPESDL